MNDITRLVALSNKPELIRYIENPTFIECKVAIENNSNVFRYIELDKLNFNKEQTFELCKRTNFRIM